MEYREIKKIYGYKFFFQYFLKLSNLNFYHKFIQIIKFLIFTLLEVNILLKNVFL